MIRYLAVLLLITVLVGCASVTPRGLIAAWQLDPLSTDPADLTVGLGVPDTLRLKDGDAYIAMGYTVDGEDNPRVAERFSLDVSPGSETPDPPVPFADETVYVAELSPTAAAQMRDTQAAIRNLREAGVDGEGTLVIGVAGGCTTAGPPTALPVRTYLRTTPEGPFVQLTRRRDFLAVLDNSGRQSLLSRIEQCK